MYTIPLQGLPSFFLRSPSQNRPGIGISSPPSGPSSLSPSSSSSFSSSELDFIPSLLTPCQSSKSVSSSSCFSTSSFDLFYDKSSFFSVESGCSLHFDKLFLSRRLRFSKESLEPAVHLAFSQVPWHHYLLLPALPILLVHKLLQVRIRAAFLALGVPLPGDLGLQEGLLDIRELRFPLARLLKHGGQVLRKQEIVLARERTFH